MELKTVASRIFESDLQCDFYKNLSNDSKEKFLADISDWMETYLNSFDTENQENAPEDKREGRIGNTAVYFTLDRSYGVIAINQEGLNVISACRFATIAASCGVFSGKWMYEFQLGSKGIMQIGWCSNKCVFTADRGCGDTTNSYAFDGSRVQAWNMLSFEYGEKWRNGDIIGSCIDLDDRTITFYRNGKNLGVAFDNIMAGADLIYIPCLSLVESESICANFGARPFKYQVEDFQPLQEEPHAKINQGNHIFNWLKNFCALTIPQEPAITNCSTQTDISDKKFWNRCLGVVCYHVNKIICSRYCLFSNFLPFIMDITNIKTFNCKQLNHEELVKCNKVLDALWLYVKDRYMDRSLQFILQHLYNNYRQVSESVECEQKKETLHVFGVFLQHENTRKYIIKNYFFERVDLLPFLTQSPLDEPCIQKVAGESWWDTKGVIPDIEKNKKTFKKAFVKIGRSYESLEETQCALLKMIFCNTDGSATTPSSRLLFLRKFRKFCWHELECSRNDFVTKIQALVAYGAFLRLLKLLIEMWKEEIGEEPIYCPPQYFYDKTLQYTHCDRVGGLEPFLSNVMHDQLVNELGENHRVFAPNNNDIGFTFHLDEVRTGVNGFIEVLDGTPITVETNSPTASNQPFLQALFLPMARETQNDNPTGNMDSKKSLIEFFEDLVIFFTSTIARHCRKLSRTYAAFNQYVSNYNQIYQKLKHMKKFNGSAETALVFENTSKLLKEELHKRARRIGWIHNVIVTPSIHQRFVIMLDAVVRTMGMSEMRGDLFVFLPDFYLETCDTLISVLVKDFILIRPVSTLKGGDNVILSVAELMFSLIGDPRIKHIDCKKTPTNIIATLAANPDNMKLLEKVEKTKCKSFVAKLMASYSDRHWKGTNWILMRFWHGKGYGFRYTHLPHHSVTNANLQSPVNYTVYNIAYSPSSHFQHFVRERLLDTTAGIPEVIDSIITELHWCFGEFLAPLQELQRAIERNEQLMMFGSLYKMCSSFFNKTITLLRTLDMFIAIAPEVFVESYYPESNSLTKRIIQIVLLIVHRISSKQGCFRTVMNSRIAVLENVDYLPIETASISVLLGVLSKEMEKFSINDMTVPLFTRIVLTDSSYDFESLKSLIGSPESKNSVVMCLHDYERDMTTHELGQASKLLKMLEYYTPLLSSIRLIPDEELCIICCSAPIEVKFVPCGHTSCLSCITYYIAKNRLCFFCKRIIYQVAKLEDDTIIEELTAREVPSSEDL